MAGYRPGELRPHLLQQMQQANLCDRAERAGNSQGAVVRACSVQPVNTSLSQFLAST